MDATYGEVDYVVSLDRASIEKRVDLQETPILIIDKFLLQMRSTAA